MYILATLLTLYFGFVGELTFTSAIIMLCLYVALVLIVYIEEVHNDKEKEK